MPCWVGVHYGTVVPEESYFEGSFRGISFWRFRVLPGPRLGFKDFAGPSLELSLHTHFDTQIPCVGKASRPPTCNPNQAVTGKAKVFCPKQPACFVFM